MLKSDTANERLLYTAMRKGVSGYNSYYYGSMFKSFHQAATKYCRQWRPMMPSEKRTDPGSSKIDWSLEIGIVKQASRS